VVNKPASFSGVPGSDLVLKTGYSERVFRRFDQSLQENAEIVP
jgi:hypothetical protein